MVVAGVVVSCIRVCVRLWEIFASSGIKGRRKGISDALDIDVAGVRSCWFNDQSVIPRLCCDTMMEEV